MTVNKSIQQLQLVLAPFKEMAMFETYEVVSPESPGMDGDTPLHVAAIEGRLDLLADMLPFVQNIDVPGDLGNTPLHCAVLWNHVEVARLLLDHGADIDYQNDYLETPLKLMGNRPGFEAIVAKYKGP